MSDIKLFQVSDQTATALEARSVDIEKRLQTIIERNMVTFLGIFFLATEYSTGLKTRGRIDSLGIDENGCPVIIEYKRSMNENVINQGLFYLDWLMDHKAEFELLVHRNLSKDKAEGIEWSSPRLICIARDFTRYDEHAVEQINRNIELIRYRHYHEGFLLLEMVNATTASPSEYISTGKSHDEASSGKKHIYKHVTQILEESTPELQALYSALESYLLSIGDDIQSRTLKFYFAFTRIKNFACVELRPQKKCLLVYVNLVPEAHPEQPGFLRDVSKIGHFGTGSMEITIRNEEDIAHAKPLLLQSYEAS
ncbi:putative transport protein [Desulfobaculum xiamenense]|uniref:Putative transport protein n=1 Tax=Desulfobaculum xiamenense TaxID=995050 RepID=A0A846QJH4_9BACT|nr:DUF5655 domain-containing protein [Desulfobaculum xiamenense]NJB67220.1 putative transport protein [Desulfobaculum xiamenense]